jgi:hypothetical protein
MLKDNLRSVDHYRMCLLGLGGQLRKLFSLALLITLLGSFLKVWGHLTSIVGVGVRGGHDALLSAIACNTASHSLRSHRLEPPILTGFG